MLSAHFESGPGSQPSRDIHRRPATSGDIQVVVHLRIAEARSLPRFRHASSRERSPIRSAGTAATIGAAQLELHLLSHLSYSMCELDACDHYRCVREGLEARHDARRRLIARWCCSMTLLRFGYLQPQTLNPNGTKSGGQVAGSIQVCSTCGGTQDSAAVVRGLNSPTFEMHLHLAGPRRIRKFPSARDRGVLVAVETIHCSCPGTLDEPAAVDGGHMVRSSGHAQWRERLAAD
jgi:hypothetical protein